MRAPITSGTTKSASRAMTAGTETPARRTTSSTRSTPAPCTSTATTTRPPASSRTRPSRVSARRRSAIGPAVSRGPPSLRRGAREALALRPLGELVARRPDAREGLGVAVDGRRLLRDERARLREEHERALEERARRLEARGVVEPSPVGVGVERPRPAAAEALAGLEDRLRGERLVLPDDD